MLAGPTSSPGDALGRRALPVLAALFAVAGASALVYQVVWRRILALHTGVGVGSVAIIVSSFMLGLGLGSHLGGLLSRRLGRRGGGASDDATTCHPGSPARFSATFTVDVPDLTPGPPRL